MKQKINRENKRTRRWAEGTVMTHTQVGTVHTWHDALTSLPRKAENPALLVGGLRKGSSSEKGPCIHTEGLNFLFFIYHFLQMLNRHGRSCNES